MRLSSRARATVSVRLAAPGLLRTWPTCFLTVSRVTTRNDYYQVGEACRAAEQRFGLRRPRPATVPRPAAGPARRGPGDWEYELVATRYPIDHSIVFLAKVRLPIGDLPEVVSRISRDR